MNSFLSSFIGVCLLIWAGAILYGVWRINKIRSTLHPGMRLGDWVVVGVDGDTVYLTSATEAKDCYVPKALVFPKGPRIKA